MRQMRIAFASAVTTIAAAACGTQPSLTDFQADSPSVYVAKVKNILVGLPPTAEEIDAVTKDPKALGGLVDTWMATPEYDAKMMVFFELAFQQTQITTNNFVDLIPTQGLGLGRDNAPLVQNVRESFARTALALVKAGKPWSDVFTTHELMMTPALMELYGFLDTRRADDNGAITDKFGTANPTLTVTIEASGGPIPIAQSFDPTSANYMHFYNPDLPNLMNFPDPSCNGMDPVVAVINNAGNQSLSYVVHDVLYGAVPLHKSATGVVCTERTTLTNAGVQLAPADFTTWNLVTIRPPNGSEPTTRFFDLPALRGASVLVLNTPHVGFFTTPAFFANWPTNSSNQARVTVNQALIVATGNAIDGSDATVPSSTPGLDATHASNPACVACHQLLDPTRSIFTATYSYFYYPQTDTKLMAVPGLFAFQGVVQSMKTIDDFAGILSTHPLVPQAWAQKLCYYANSSPCDAADPEFQRIVTNFSKSGSWSALVHDVMTSPLTTNTSETETARANGEVVAVSRRDHLCAALNNRLGFVDICQLDATLANTRAPSVIAQIVSGMPSDGYGRGSTIPVLPNDPTLFYRAGLENICEQVAQMTIDAKPAANQPGTKIWSSSDPNGAIGEFVTLVMGLVPADPRAPAVAKELQSHFAAAQAQGATATDSLRSTFVAACLSPSFIGIGM
jgi:hypothetical protein